MAMAARILDDRPPLGEGPLRAAIRRAHRADEAATVATCWPRRRVEPEPRARIQARARRLAERVRQAGGDQLGVEAFLHEYSLSTREGIMLMCLAEALLRIPDPETSDRLIRDKLSFGDWDRHLGHSESLFVNASTWGLMLTGRLIRVDLERDGEVGTRFARLVQRLGEPVVRQAIQQAMRVLGRHFVLGQTIEAAIRRARELEQKGYRYSYDMLGEGAKTTADAVRYQLAYRDAIAAIVKAAEGDDLMARPSISIKLSALHPRYELAQHRRLEAELLPRLLELLTDARAGRITVTIDAEEADRLEPSLDLFEHLAAAPELGGWDGLGLAVQAYQKRALHVIAWLEDLARRHRRRIPVRLVKGAYWDTEIKRAQEQGFDDYPVFTRKLATDVSYLACARRLLAGGEAFYPQFATHNAQTLASIIELAGDRRAFEFQRLHGMGEALYADLKADADLDIACRVYAPGRQPPGPAALPGAPPARERRQHLLRQPHPRPGDPDREPGRGPGAPARAPRAEGQPEDPAAAGALWRERARTRAASIWPIPRSSRGLAARIEADFAPGLVARPGVGDRRSAPRTSYDPADRSRAIGRVDRRRRRQRSSRRWRWPEEGFPAWDRTPVEARAACLERAADLYEANAPELLAWCVREAGKTMIDAVAEVREAVDFLRYYAAEARAGVPPRELPGPDRREQPDRAARARRVRDDQPLELPARDLHRPDRRGARGRQRRDRQAGAADAADRRQGGGAPACRRACPRTP